MALNPNLNSLAYFEAVARLGRVTLAATELGVSSAAISQQIKALEGQYGVMLFRRVNRRLTLTLNGEMLFQATTSALQLIRGAQATIREQHDTYNLKLRVSPTFGVHWLSNRLKRFIDTHPDWGLRVDATPDFTNFETEVVDLDLRYGTGAWNDLYSECIIHDLVMPLCSPDYLAQLQAGGGTTAEQLGRARIIRCMKALYQWEIWMVRHGVEHVEKLPKLRFDRSSMVIDLARQGAGVILESMTLALDDLKRGTLVPFSPVFPAVQFPAYWIVCPPRHTNRRIVRLFSEWVREEAREHEEQAQAILAAYGCTHRPVEEMELVLG
ncbi:LysR substrate-binding domain-containing protein [Oceaniovalibus sp. ACAM 378]|uniref:LysR substrate-binding domain-containing protein n=1 Tax=Vreelandella neptunia TaxID=115551 RepID=A0ABS9SCE3_9GAMM|nr:LysR substrate-binding domain-containing protein [Oceaniovalibus sp. ACAM 378]MCH4813762.1 LysR substrate-binding domain-containing protein [Halomonas neptunia]TYB84029.1 LysR family transcriptional regulator [Oceaniovalibus sp. ACAM 378]